MTSNDWAATLMWLGCMIAITAIVYIRHRWPFPSSKLTRLFKEEAE